MKYQVYHVIDPTYMVTSRESSDFPNGFEKVAEVESDRLGEVYRLTNHIDWAWWENKGVTCFKKTRSTSVGDVVVDEQGHKHVCAMAGWQELTPSCPCPKCFKCSCGNSDCVNAEDGICACH